MIRFLFLFFIVVFLSGCSSTKDRNLIRLAYMPNVTHSVPLIGIEKGIFQAELGEKYKLKPMHFVVGNSIIDAFITNQIDIAYIGPGPYINSIYRNVPLKLLANSCNGGTTIVGVETCTDIETCHGMSPQISVPQYGNTQDLILRKFLENNKIQNAKVIAIPPQDTATAFYTMSIDAACLPEPWGTILIDKTKCHLLKDENQVLNNGNYPVTILLTTKDFASKHPDVINSFIAANDNVINFINSNNEESIDIVQSSISKITKKDIKRELISKSMKRCTFNNFIDLNILKIYASIGVKAGYYKEELLNRL